MAEKIVVGDARKCASCILCMMLCSFRKYEEFNPSKAAIRIIYNEENLPCEIVFTEDCEICGECVTYCPREALQIVEIEG